MKNSAALKIVGHRGARGLAPENTLVSIRKALEHHVDEVEVDVRVTQDDVAILHHDLYLYDQAGNRYNIRHTPYKTLLNHKPDLATLDQAITYIDRKVPLQIEVKRGEKTKPIIRVVRKYLRDGWRPADFLFGSKSQKTLQALHQAAPDIPIVVIEPSLSLLAYWRLRRFGPDAVRLSMNHRWLWKGVIRSLQKNNCQLYAYTLDDALKAKRWAHSGMVGVITDRPDLYETAPAGAHTAPTGRNAKDEAV